VTDFLSVLDAERTLLEAQDRLAASQTRTATAYVAVYTALGGGVPLTEENNERYHIKSDDRFQLPLPVSSALHGMTYE